MPDLSGLYPQPPQQNQSLLSGNPQQLIGTLGELQRIGILNQQAPALMQEPAANLQNTQIANQTAQIQQQEAARKLVWGALGNGINGMGNPSPDDVHNTVVNLSRAYPQIATQYPDIFNSASDMLLAPGGIKKNAAVMMNSVMSPEAASAPTDVGFDSQTGRTTTGTRGQFNVTAASGPVSTQAPPGTAESAQVMQSDLQRAGTFSQDMFPWQQALKKLQALGPGATAPGSQGRQELESFIYGLAPSLVPQTELDKIKNYADLQKYLTNAMQQRAQNLGPHTNEGLSTMATGSPNVNINDMSVDELIKANIGLRRAEQAQILESAKAGPANYTGAKAQIAGNQDITAFGMDMMSPEQIAGLQKNLKGGARAKFNSSLHSAISNGLITPPGQ